MMIEPLLNRGTIREAKILLVDDHEDGVALLQQILQKAGYPHVFPTTDSRETVRMCEEIGADLLILDLNMPPPSGYDILDQLALRPGKENRFPILVLTADITPMAKLKALSLGAKDFLTKPVEQVDLLLRVRNLLEMQFASRQIEQARHARGADGGNDVLDRLFATIECCDRRLAERSVRISRWAALLAKSIGLSTQEVNRIEKATRVHDLGMLAIPEDLRNCTVLSAEEKRIYRTHVSVVDRILGVTAGGSDGLKVPLEIATCHHERWDGGGYPLGLSGEAIPLPARIVAVAGAIDLLMHPETCVAGASMEGAFSEVARNAGFAFDPAIIKALPDVAEAAPAEVSELELLNS